MSGFISIEMYLALADELKAYKEKKSISRRGNQRNESAEPGTNSSFSEHRRTNGTDVCSI